MEPLIVKHPLLSVVSAILLAGCAATTEEVSKGTPNNPTFGPHPEAVRVGAFDLKRDPIDLVTGEHLDKSGQVPPRANDESKPSYAFLQTEKLWQEIIKSENYVFVAVKSPGQARGFYQDKLLIGAAEVARIKSDMLATIPGLLEARGTEFQLPKTVTGMVFPGFPAKIEKLTALTELRARRDLDYVEPLYFKMLLESGCGYEPYVPSSLPWLQDETKYGLGPRSEDVVPYTFRHLGITNAWHRFPSPGGGIMVAVLDTGISLTQDQLQGRVGATHLDSTGTGLHDTCGHGTKVAGILAAPHDGRNIVGALYAAHLTTVKVGHAPAQDVFSGGGWVCDGIAKAVKGDPTTGRVGAQVVNMSFGFLISSPTVEACIRSAFDSTPVIFVAAAGTGPQGGVIFPANMNREVIAVTAVDINGPGTYHMIGGAQTTSVGYGQDVDFASVYAANRMPSPGEIGTDNYVGQATNPAFPPGVVGRPYTQIAAGGGTSSAAPTLSAVFGLTLQGQLTPTTRADIIAQVASASTIVNVRNADGSQIGIGHIGAGIPDAYAVVGGTTRFDVAGPAQVQAGQPFTYYGESNGASALNYAWTYKVGNNVTQQYTKTVTFPAQSTPGLFQFSVIALDPVDGRSFTATRAVSVIANPVPPPTSRNFSSAAFVYHHPSWGSSGQFDQIVNAGISMPSGCVVQGRYGHLQCPDGTGGFVDCPQTGDETFANYGGRGFSIPAHSGSSNSLATNVHYWHDSFNGVVVRVKYRVLQPAGVVCDVPGFTQP